MFNDPTPDSFPHKINLNWASCQVRRFYSIIDLLPHLLINIDKSIFMKRKFFIPLIHDCFTLVWSQWGKCVYWKNRGDDGRWLSLLWVPSSLGAGEQPKFVLFWLKIVRRQPSIILTWWTFKWSTWCRRGRCFQILWLPYIIETLTAVKRRVWN